MDPFIGKTLDSLSENDLQGLIDREVGESISLEYKEMLHICDPNRDIARNYRQEFLRDISAMANSWGGLLLYGISERRNNGTKTGLPSELKGVQVGSKDEFGRRIESLIRDGIDESLPGIVNIAFVPLKNGCHVVAIRCHKSYRAPHRVILGKANDFCMRVNNGIQQMTTAQIRDSVLSVDQAYEKARNWCSARRSEVCESLKDSYWVMHYLPLVRQNGIVDATDTHVHDALDSVSVPCLNSQQYAEGIYCFEGYQRRWSKMPQERVIFFRDGAVEFQSEYSVHQSDEGLFNHAKFEIAIGNAIRSLQKLLTQGILPSPGYLSLSLFGIEGSSIWIGDPAFFSCFKDDHSQHEITTKHIGPIEAYILDPRIENDKLMKSLLDVVWNAAGYAGCQGFDETGKYVGYKDN